MAYRPAPPYPPKRPEPPTPVGRVRPCPLAWGRVLDRVEASERRPADDEPAGLDLAVGSVIGAVVAMILLALVILVLR